MKRSVFTFVGVVVALLVISSSALVAQGMRISPKDRADTLKVRIGLNDKQTEQVAKIYEEQQTEFQKLREENMGDREAMRAAMTEIMQKTDAKIEKLLDKAQLKKYEAFKKERQERMQQRRPG